MLRVRLFGMVCVLAWLPAFALSSANETISHRYLEGLRAWRKPGKIDHAACANCHGPDGLELAVYDFDNKTLRRRTAPHLGPRDAEAIIDLIQAVRTKYRIRKRLRPMVDRPYQPGGSVLPGATAAQRDLAFGRELVTKLPELTTGRLDTPEKALRAQAALLALDPHTLPIGIPFNRFSEDAFHGREHASLAHWLPDVPRILDDAHAKVWYGLQDAYLKDPTDARLMTLLDDVESLSPKRDRTGIATLADAKYRSLLILQHGFRKQLLGQPLHYGAVAFGDRPGALIPNPMWEVADTARHFAESGPEALGMTGDLLTKKTEGPSFEHQILDLEVSWFWLGWLFDQGLARTTLDPKGIRGDWMSLALWNAGPYPIHNVYWQARRQVVMNSDPRAWQGIPGRKQFQWDFLGLQLGGRYRSQTPTNPVQRDLYQRFTANCFRMSLFAFAEDLRKEGIVWGRGAQHQHVRALTDYIAEVDPGDAQRAQLFARDLDRVMLDAKEKF